MRFWRRHRHRHDDPLVCREFVELVTDYLDDRLPASQRARFEAHLAECDGCAGYLADVRGIAESLHQLPPPPPDEATRDVLVRAFRELRGAD